MSILTVYRMLLCLYPYSFRRQFAEEMIEVFRQKTQSLVAVKGLVFTSFVFHEFIGLLLGAAGAWMMSIMPRKKHFVISIPMLPKDHPTAEEAALSTTELQQRLDARKANVDRAAAKGDLATARAYDAEVARLQLFLNRRNRPRKSRATRVA
jgi:hypothetical protein